MYYPLVNCEICRLSARVITSAGNAVWYIDVEVIAAGVHSKTVYAFPASRSSVAIDVIGIGSQDGKKC